MGTYKVPHLGDVFEIATPQGLAYLQFVYKDAILGHLIRVLPGLYVKRPSSLRQLVEETELYFVFFTLGAASRRGIVQWVSRETLPPQPLPPPMRLPVGMPREGRTLTWRIMDQGNVMVDIKDIQKVPLVRHLTAEQRRLSLVELWNDILLIERLCEGWMPEKDV